MGRKRTRKAEAAIDFLDGLLEVGIKFYSFVEAEAEKRRLLGAGAAASDPYALLGIDRALPVPEKKKRYWRLQHLVHTDVGGDQHLSKLINGAWKEICDREGFK